MRKFKVILLVILLALAFVACDGTSATTSSQTTTTTTTTTGPKTTTTVMTTIATLWLLFDFELMQDETYFTDSLDNFVIVSGHNIASADYIADYDFSSITFKYEYLSTLEPGYYEFSLIRTDLADEIIHVQILDKHQSNRILNQGFETGNLFGWISLMTFKGESAMLAFTDQEVVANETISGTEYTYGGNGNFVLGLDHLLSASFQNEKLGLLRSSEFVLSGSGFITYYLGGATDPNLTYLSVRNAEDDTEVARFGQSADRGAIDDPRQLTLYKADLSDYLGEPLYVELVDAGSHDGNAMIFDDIETYHETTPETGILATNIVPMFNQPYYTNQVENGSFDEGLTGWTGSANFQVEAGVLKSNLGGDAATGIIRSSLFRIDGSGIISLYLGAAQGTWYDKDTIVSIRESGTNRELFRFANRNHDGIFMVQYFVDLSEYIGKICYFEIVDNGSGSYDTIFMDGIVTHYETEPTFDYSQMAVNLND